MMVLEKGAYHEMASYLAQHFHGDADVGKVMESIANSLLHDVALVALCRGWPETLPLAALAKLPELIDTDEPVTAWLFASKADAALMAKYVVRYPRKLMQDDFGEPRYGIEAVRGGLQTDQESRKLVFAAVQKVTAARYLDCPRQIARTIDAHRPGISHLDFKPAESCPRAAASFVSSRLMCLPIPASPLNSHYSRHC
jgi:hypothetical protein